MRRIVWSALILAGLAAAWVLAGAPALRAQPAGGATPLAKGWGRLVASGTLTAVDPSSGTATLAITGTGRLETFEGGTAWRQKTLSGTHVVRLLPATLLIDADAHPVAPATLHAGEPASVWAAVRPDASILALTLQMTSPRPRAVIAGPRAGEGSAGGTAGVVIQRSGQVLTLLTPAGARRNVIITAATTVRSRGQPAKEAVLAPYDVLRVDGLVNSDGSLAATRIDVEFAAGSAAQVSGPVEQHVSGLGGLVVGGTMVCTFAETYIIHNDARETLASVAPARLAVVYGTPIVAGTTTVGVEARVVVVR